MEENDDILLYYLPSELMAKILVYIPWYELYNLYVCFPYLRYGIALINRAAYFKLNHSNLKEVYGIVDNVLHADENEYMHIKGDSQGPLLEYDNYSPKKIIYVSAPILTNKKNKIIKILRELWFLRLKFTNTTTEILKSAIKSVYGDTGTIYLFLDLSDIYTRSIKDDCILNRVHTVATNNKSLCEVIPYCGYVHIYYKNVYVRDFSKHYKKTSKWSYTYDHSKYIIQYNAEIKKYKNRKKRNKRKQDMHNINKTPRSYLK